MLSRYRIHPVLLALTALLLLAPGRAARAVSSPGGDAGKADTVVVVVSAESPVEEISRARLADIYLGRKSRFPGGQEAVPIDQAEDSPVRKTFYETFLGRSPAEVKAHWSKMIFTGRGRPPRDVPDGEAVKEIVADDRRAIGYLDHSLVDGSVRVVKVGP